MLFKITETLKPNKEILDTLTKYKTTNGKIKILENTNLQFILPIIYTITKPTHLTIYEYKINEISNKRFYIKEYNQKYNLKEILILVVLRVKLRRAGYGRRVKSLYRVMVKLGIYKKHQVKKDMNQRHMNR